MNEKNKHFANWVKLFLLKSQLSVRQLALLAGLEHASIGQYTRGERLPRISSFIFLTKAVAKYQNKEWIEIILEAIIEIEKDI
jgi:transcriptional regulator with XRE-family HTH domain